MVADDVIRAFHALLQEDPQGRFDDIPHTNFVTDVAQAQDRFPSVWTRQVSRTRDEWYGGGFGQEVLELASTFTLLDPDRTQMKRVYEYIEAVGSLLRQPRRRGGWDTFYGVDNVAPLDFAPPWVNIGTEVQNGFVDDGNAWRVAATGASPKGYKHLNLGFVHGEGPMVEFRYAGRFRDDLQQLGQRIASALNATPAFRWHLVADYKFGRTVDVFLQGTTTITLVTGVPENSYRTIRVVERGATIDGYVDGIFKGSVTELNTGATAELRWGLLLLGDNFADSIWDYVAYHGSLAGPRASPDFQLKYPDLENAYRTGASVSVGPPPFIPGRAEPIYSSADVFVRARVFRSL